MCELLLFLDLIIYIYQLKRFPFTNFFGTDILQFFFYICLLLHHLLEMSNSDRETDIGVL